MKMTGPSIITESFWKPCNAEYPVATRSCWVISFHPAGIAAGWAGGLSIRIPSRCPNQKLPSAAATVVNNESTGAGRTASSDVQKANSLAAFTLFNIGLLHQNDRSHREARESYEIAVSMMDGVPAHLTPWNVGLLRVFLLLRQTSDELLIHF